MAGQKQVLHVDEPVRRISCVVADSPHSGTDYPDDFGFACDLAELKKAEDTGVDRLFSFFPRLGVPFLQADFPRAYVDPNRKDVVTEKFKADEEGIYTGSGAGLVREKCTPRSSQKVYDRKLSLKEVFNRVASCHKPYHDKLGALLDDAVARTGRAVHINCHSMPSTVQRGTAHNPVDIAIGTSDGKTAAPEYAEKLRALFAAKGYNVAIDMPGYRGAEIITRHGDPAAGRHCLQLEVNRRLYLDEETLVMKPDAQKLQADLQAVMADFVSWCDSKPQPKPAAVIKPR